MELPRYVCASEVGFLPMPTEIAFAKMNYKVAVGQRVEQGDEFNFEGPPGRWMEPMNEAARLKASEQVNAKKRKNVAAEVTAATTPVVPPRSGMASNLATVSPEMIGQHRDVATDARVPQSSAAPRRRAAKSN